MGIKFHINKYGVPAICNSPMVSCPYGSERHFKTYEDAKVYADLLSEEIKTGIPLDKNDPAKKIKSYYNSFTAINEFPINRKIADLESFEFIIVSWLAKRTVESEMRYNRIGSANFTYGDIVRILNEEIKGRFGEGLNLEKYYNPIPHEFWEDSMVDQRNLYGETTHTLAGKLGFKSMEIISLPMSARRRLSYDGFLLNPQDIHEVIYRVYPAVSWAGNIVAYNHNTNEMSNEFDVFEIAGVVEGYTLHNLCYSEKIEDEFESVWEKIRQKGYNDVNYEHAMKRYKEQHFFKGIEGTDIPKIFIRMSPVVAQEIAKFVKNYNAIMFAVEDILSEQGVSGIEYEFDNEEDDGDWIIE